MRDHDGFSRGKLHTHAHCLPDELCDVRQQHSLLYCFTATSLNKNKSRETIHPTWTAHLGCSRRGHLQQEAERPHGEARGTGGSCLQLLLQVSCTVVGRFVSRTGCRARGSTRAGVHRRLIPCVSFYVFHFVCCFPRPSTQGVNPWANTETLNQFLEGARAVGLEFGAVGSSGEACTSRLSRLVQPAASPFQLTRESAGSPNL